MGKLRLDLQNLVVESFESGKETSGERSGTVRANSTQEVSCFWELCQGQETADPRLRACHTPYFECATDGWTCIYCGG
jgi:hypothetical protein